AKRRGPLALSTKVDQLSTELAQIKVLLHSPGGWWPRREFPFEFAIASLIVPPDEVLRPNARCPRLQCRVTDSLLCRAYDSGARMGRIGNSLSHLMLGLSSSLELVPLDQSTQGLLDASLQASALMTHELGRTLSMLVHAKRQVWLLQSSLTKPCRRTPTALPVVPGVALWLRRA
ncbi:hypothetical protein GOODEAATRI_015014, partial [Goodea atripinnis]